MVFIPTDEAVRKKMKKFREDAGISLKDMAKRCRTSVIIIGIVENGGVTHPNIARRIQLGYYLTDEEGETLIPENRRPNSPCYDPDKFVMQELPNKNDPIVVSYKGNKRY